MSSEPPKRNAVKETPGHTVIVGLPGSGKTYYAMFKHFLALPKKWTAYSKPKFLKEYNIFFDTNGSTDDIDYQRELRFYANNVYRKDIGFVHTFDELIKMYNAGIHHIIVCRGIRVSIESYKEMVYTILDAIRESQGSMPVTTLVDHYFYVDEISRLTPKIGETPITELWTTGRRLKMWGIGISQRPAMVNMNIYMDSIHSVVFRIRDEERKALRSSKGLNIPEDVMEDLKRTKYLFYYYDGSMWYRGKGGKAVNQYSKGERNAVRIRPE